MPTSADGTPQDAQLTFQCQELGVFKYTLKLRATVPATQPTLSFETPLGNSQVETFT